MRPCYMRRLERRAVWRAWVCEVAAGAVVGLALVACALYILAGGPA